MTMSRPMFTEAVCNKCRHFNWKSTGACAAFPEEIPDDIWLAKNDHTSPYPGDSGMVFEELSKEEIDGKRNQSAWKLRRKSRRWKNKRAKGSRRHKKAVEHRES